MSGHYVDVPVTDLDDPEDDIILDRTDVSDVLNLDYELDNNSLHIDNNETDETLASKLKTSVTRIFGGRNQKYKRFTQLDNSYELEDRNTSSQNLTENDDDSVILNFKDFTDLGIDRIQRTTTITLKRYQFYALLLSLAGFLIGFIVVLATRSGTDSKNSHIAKESSKAVFSNGTADFYPTTILISLDGFHPHYISEQLTPFMHTLMTQEYGAPYMIPSFPSSTFPNHWTLVTGLYPSEHGIIGNTFYDPTTKKQFVNTKPELSLIEQWWGGEAVWATAALQGVTSAIHMWPGSEVPFSNPSVRPLVVDAFNKTEELSRKVDRVLEWIDRDIKTRPELILSYVPTVDTLGHLYGISDRIDEGLASVDKFVQSVFEGIENRNLGNIVNIIVVSDHGMAPTSDDRIIFLDDIVNLTKIEHIDGWPLFALRPYQEYSASDIFEEMLLNHKKDAGKANYDVYSKENLPEEWHFGGKIVNKFSERLAPLWVIPKVGYSVITKEDWEKKYHNYTPLGVHGYNNTEVLMRATFLASGPFFRKKMGTELRKVKPFENVEVYNIVCETLNIQPSANNGSDSLVAGELSSYINKNNALAEEWRDVYDYPNVSFTHDVNIMRESATYDTLWRMGLGDTKQSTDSEKEEDEEEAPSTSEPADTPAADAPADDPKPELEEPAEDVDSENDSGEDEEPSEDSGEESSEEEEDDDKLDDDKDDKEDEEHENHGLLDIVDDIMEDIGDAIDDAVDSIEDKFDEIVHHGKNDD